jgi:hypothetical protein
VAVGQYVSGRALPGSDHWFRIDAPKGTKLWYKVGCRGYRCEIRAWTSTGSAGDTTSGNPLGGGGGGGISTTIEPAGPLFIQITVPRASKGPVGFDLIVTEAK